MNDDRAEALRIFQAGVQAADPFAAVSETLDDVDTPALIVAVGKAARLMAQAALVRFAGVPCLVVTNYENASPLEGAEVLAAGHPVPDENGAAAAHAVIAALHDANGPVLALISGGGSALLPAPAGALTLADKAKVNDLLLASGQDIVAMNLVRQQLSDLKGGGFLRHAVPQKVTALILSDVIGDDLSAIASGPTVGPIGTASDAIALLKRASLWAKLPNAVRTHLHEAKAPAPLPEADNRLIGSNSKSVDAMARAAGHARPARVHRRVLGGVPARRAVRDRGEARARAARGARRHRAAQERRRRAPARRGRARGDRGRPGRDAAGRVAVRRDDALSEPRGGALGHPHARREPAPMMRRRTRGAAAKATPWWRSRRRRVSRKRGFAARSRARAGGG